MKSKHLAIAILAGSLAAGAFAQTDAVPEFEAASIKAAPPPTGNGIRVMMRGGPGSDDPGRVDWSNVSLRQMITAAFNVKDYQVQGPDWLNSQRFDVVAKIPPGTTKEQYRLMIQKLLTDRFKMTFHREEKEHAAYALVVGKGGPKFKESDPNDTSGFAPMMMRGPDGDVRASAPPPPPPPPGGAGRGPDAGPGRGGGGRGGMMMMGPGHLQAKKMGIDGLANMLSNITGKPVIDQTELKGSYDFTLDYAPETGEGGPMMMAPPPGGGEGRGPMASEPAGLNIYAAVQQELGLKLEPKKLPVENIIIDGIGKVPSEN
ncbi:MAG: TIGR03435 family protein [Candidatus Sulfopaludibacter sp.]|nr:TIGR03435 family protein [Candidatus Sulfopaludibacter sp.]